MRVVSIFSFESFPFLLKVTSGFGRWDIRVAQKIDNRPFLASQQMGGNIVRGHGWKKRVEPILQQGHCQSFPEFKKNLKVFLFTRNKRWEN